MRFHNASYIYESPYSQLIINKEPIIVNTFLGCDPATDIEKNTSDFSVEMVGAMDSSRRIYVLEYRRERGAPTIGMRSDRDELIGKSGVVDNLIELYDFYHCVNGRVEDVAMNRSVFGALNTRKIKLGRLDIVISGYPPGGVEKHNRIHTALSSLFATGMIFIRENMLELINEIINFSPRMAHDDTIEALYYLIIGMYPPQGYAEQRNKEGRVTGFMKKQVKRRPWYLM
jgi:hypothetical protein